MSRSIKRIMIDGEKREIYKNERKIKAETEKEREREGEYQLEERCCLFWKTRSTPLPFNESCEWGF